MGDARQLPGYAQAWLRLCSHMHIRAFKTWGHKICHQADVLTGGATWELFSRPSTLAGPQSCKRSLRDIAKSL